MIKLFKQHAASSGGVQWVIAGLGNPGSKYEKTRHNVGFEAIDLLAKELGVSVNRSRFKALCGEAEIAGQRVLLLKPQTFMNLSGESTREALAWYKVPVERLIVLHDDISLNPGRIRIRAKGSAGGHNGLKSIIAQHGSDNFPRVKIGVGMPPHPDYDMPDWVLGTFDKNDGLAVADAICRSIKAAEEIIRRDVMSAANRYNSTDFKPEG
ncbi:MAG: aminoacyl-tRNA hydrolase [Ruminococcaceae bacterium]|nr:aminoacyl-tRNA hydrolase [Oscillospiraceae bacterium]